MKFVYAAMSKHLYYFRDYISKYVLEHNAVAFNPFSIPYFMLDTVPRGAVRNANNELVGRCDELWVFGKISNGVLAEIKLAESLNKPVKYFRIADSKDIAEIKKEEAEIES